MQDIISIQLYSLRDYGNLARQLETLASIGFRHVETIGSHLANAAETRALLDLHGMTAPSGHVGLADLRERFDWVADQAAAIGISQLYMPAVPPASAKACPLTTGASLAWNWARWPCASRAATSTLAITTTIGNCSPVPMAQSPLIC
ncbi:sugar phosphate isomerase/epimerase family protein [Pannonibacter phragmitetus]|uniref:sugar phosphate isomerase/epimerase family protein n=1 Tax=Pannonibacter phragmitetus TaxID=121719 RepID=UPI003D2EBC1A